MKRHKPRCHNIDRTMAPSNLTRSTSCYHWRRTPPRSTDHPSRLNVASSSKAAQNHHWWSSIMFPTRTTTSCHHWNKKTQPRSPREPWNMLLATGPWCKALALWIVHRSSANYETYNNHDGETLILERESRCHVLDRDDNGMRWGKVSLSHTHPHRKIHPHPHIQIQRVSNFCLIPIPIG